MFFVTICSSNLTDFVVCHFFLLQSAGVGRCCGRCCGERVAADGRRFEVKLVRQSDPLRRVGRTREHLQRVQPVPAHADFVRVAPVGDDRRITAGGVDALLLGGLGTHDGVQVVQHRGSAGNDPRQFE